VESEVVSLSFIPTDNQLADILTKPLDGSRFESLQKAIGLCVTYVLSSESMMFLIKKINKFGEFCSRVVLFQVCQLPLVPNYISLAHCALIN
jgi:hypothetical protein